ncbi:hypothetical protein E4U43_003036 [Claviceps pusilla]|uniref:Uncharacterized protein n=1 Tax=Claviceps pusilla TaxID=123648 RepID=A0A9P7NHT1_9HYPO|nr:hypothetical protein E4U43_003036 [Claviceps pusilla]
MHNLAPRTSIPEPHTVAAADTTTLDDLDQALRRIHSYAEIRLFIAGTANFGHQASSVDLLLRLVGDYAYAGLVTVVYDEGNPGCGLNVEKLPRLLPRYMHGDGPGPDGLPRQMHAATVQWFPLQDFARPESDSHAAGSRSKLVDFGLTGGAEIGRVYRCSLADMLNVRTALKAQPFQWPWCRDGLDFHSSSRLAPIDLLSGDRLGSRLFHTAYRLPSTVTTQSSCPRPRPEGCGHDQENDSFLRRLLAARAPPVDDTWTSLSCVYGLRQTNGVSQIEPANLLYIYIVALLEGATTRFPKPSGKDDESPHRTRGPRILVLNFDKFWADAFARLQDYLHGRHGSPSPHSTSRNRGSTLPTSGNLSTCVRCIHRLEQLPDALDWFQEQSPRPHVAETPGVPAAAHRWTNTGVRILYAHVGFVSPEAFLEALQQANLPIIFEGQHTASAVASLGKPYLKLQDSVLQCPTQVMRIPDDMHRHSDVIARIQDASLSLQSGALGDTAFEQSVDSVASLVAECADSESQLNAYLDHLRSFYQQRGQDKFEQLLRAWNRFACLQRPERMSDSDAEAAARRRRMPRMVEEVVLDVENVRKMLAEFGL